MSVKWRFYDRREFNRGPGGISYGFDPWVLRFQKNAINGLTLMPCRRIESVTTISVNWINCKASGSGKPCSMAYIK